jgi:putative transposase
MTRSSTPRRRASEWQALVEQWQQSGLSARQFCREHSVGYASFCQWRKRFQTDHTSSLPNCEPAFVDLAALGQSSHEPGWHIVLRLGNGVELALSQS